MQNLARAALLALSLAATGCAQQAVPASSQSAPASTPTAPPAPAPTAQDCARVREMWRQAGMQPQHMADCP